MSFTYINLGGEGRNTVVDTNRHIQSLIGSVKDLVHVRNANVLYRFNDGMKMG